MRRHALLPWILVFACTAVSAVEAPQYTAESWAQWKAARDKDLVNVRTSYLSVVDHALLRKGESRYLPVGGPKGQLGWRKEAPGKPMITVTERDNHVDLMDSSTHESLELTNNPTGWESAEGLLATVERVGEDFLLILRDPGKEGFKGFKASPFFAFEPKAVASGKLVPLAHPEKQTVMTTQEKSRPVWYLGMVEFLYDGKKAALKTYSLSTEPSRQELFIPFLDATNGIETYAGGRYVEASADAAGTVVIDFNRAYNPYCARNHIYSCIKVSGKPVEIRILAGEKNPQLR